MTIHIHDFRLHVKGMEFRAKELRDEARKAIIKAETLESEAKQLKDKFDFSRVESEK